MEISTQESYYISGNAKIHFDYNKEYNVYELCGIDAKTDNFIIPDKINGLDVVLCDDIEYFNERISDRITVSEDNKYFVVIDDVLLSRDGKKLYIYMHKKKDESYIVPSGVEVISEDAFCNQYLKNIVISDGVKRIYQYAFACSKNVERIYLPASLEMVSLKTFYFFGNGNLQVFYGGTPEQWQKIDFAFGNDEVRNANIHYNSPVPDMDENGFVFK